MPFSPLCRRDLRQIAFASVKVVHKITRQHAYAFVAPPLPAVQARPQAKRHAQTTATCPTHMFGCRPRPTKTSLHPPTWLRSRGARRAPAAPAAYRSRQHPTTAWSGGYRADRTVAGGVSAEGLACLLGAVLHVCGCVWEHALVDARVSQCACVCLHGLSGLRQDRSCITLHKMMCWKGGRGGRTSASSASEPAAPNHGMVRWEEGLGK